MTKKLSYEELEQRVKELEKDAIGSKCPEEALRKSERFLQDVFNAIRDGISVLDLDLKIVRVNSWMEEMYSKKGELVGRKCYEIFQKRDTPCPWCPSLKTIETGEIHSTIVPYPSEENPTGWIDLSSFPLRNAEGNMVGVIEYVKNITRQKRAEESLQKSEEKYRLLAENASDVIWTRDMNLNLTYVSPSIEEITGYSVEESMALPNSERMTPASMELMANIFEEELKLEAQGDADPSRARTIEIEMICKDGSTVWVEVTVKFIRNQTGQAVGMLGISRDVHDRKRVEEKLRESETRLRTIFDVSQAGIILVDPQGVITYANQGMAKMFRCTLQELIGSSYPEHVHPDQRNIGDQRMRQLIAGEIDSVAFERHYIRLDGTDFWGFLSGQRHEDEQGNLISLVGNIADITERKTLENELRQAQKMETIGALAGGIAHDFNNALFSIIGYTDLTMDDVPEGSLAQSNLKEVLIAANRAKDMIQQILTFSRQTETEKKPVKVQSVVKEAIKLLKISIPTIIEIHQNIDEDCRPVMADPTQIHQVVMNLATNAYHSMREKGGILKIDVAKEKISMDDSAFYPDLHPGTYIKLSVSDTGHGMDKGVMEKIFDPYFTTKPVGEGTGMGLSTIHGIVKSHGGNIKVYSEPDKGTVFHVYFPMIETKPVEPAIVSTGPVQKGSESILLVDDEEPIVLGIRLQFVQAVRMHWKPSGPVRTNSILSLLI